ncbi:MAG: cobalamin biosynthesis protein [Candidatus Methanospirareceae archaeon]
MENREVFIGVGFHKDVSAEEIEGAIYGFLKELGIGLEEVEGLCTADFRRCKEIERVSAELSIPLLFFSKEEINSVEVKFPSKARNLDVKGVAEPCAILAAKRKKKKVEYIKRKSYDKKITLAVVF